MSIVNKCNYVDAKHCQLPQEIIFHRRVLHRPQQHHRFTNILVKSYLPATFSHVFADQQSLFRIAAQIIFFLCRFLNNRLACRHLVLKRENIKGTERKKSKECKKKKIVGKREKKDRKRRVREAE